MFINLKEVKYMGVKKEKTLSAEQLAKKEAKRLKEIAKLEKEKNKSIGIGYFACFLFIITVVYQNGQEDSFLNIIGGR